MSQTLNLYRLQQIDSQIDRTRARLQAIQKEMEDESRVQTARETVKRSEEAQLAANAAQEKAEKELLALQIKIQQVDSSLYGAVSHSPKELQDLQNDLAAMKKHRTILEDIQLKSMMDLELAETVNGQAKQELDEALTFLASRNMELGQERDLLQKSVDKLTTERQAASAAIPEQTARLYDRLREQKRGVAIATITDNSCDACGSTLSLAQVQSARSSSQMATCPSCGRILYGS